MYNKYYENTKVFLTGHTGFKGSWLSLWLNLMGADVTGYALQPDTEPNLYDSADIASKTKSIFGDIADFEKLKNSLQESRAEIIFHLAAQPLVRLSYKEPRNTFMTNVMGTVNILEAARQTDTVRTVVIITTDKVYKNNEWVWGYRENDALGGFDPYSSSKACSELVSESYINSFFKDGACIATARAGNVIGGGDWSAERIIPDAMKAFASGEKLIIRNPHSTRPWQHVLEPLSGYLSLGAKLLSEGKKYEGAWNFGPYTHDTMNVEELVKSACSTWGDNASYLIQKEGNAPHETNFLQLDCSKAMKGLGWKPILNSFEAVEKTVEWYNRYYTKNENALDLCIEDINQFVADSENKIKLSESHTI